MSDQANRKPRVRETDEEKLRRARRELEEKNRKSLADATAKLVKSRTEGSLHEVAIWIAKPLARKPGAY